MVGMKFKKNIGKKFNNFEIDEINIPTKQEWKDNADRISANIKKIIAEHENDPDLAEILLKYLRDEGFTILNVNIAKISIAKLDSYVLYSIKNHVVVNIMGLNDMILSISVTPFVDESAFSSFST